MDPETHSPTAPGRLRQVLTGLLARVAPLAVAFLAVMSLVGVTVVAGWMQQHPGHPSAAEELVVAELSLAGTGEASADEASAENGTVDDDEGAVELTRNEEDLLRRLVAAEAQGEPYVGQVAVAAVVLNRMEDADFPSTLSGVVYERWQFEPVDNGALWSVRPGERQRRAVEEALNGRDPTGGAVYFFNYHRVSNAFLWQRPHAVTIGDHRFTH